MSPKKFRAWDKENKTMSYRPSVAVFSAGRVWINPALKDSTYEMMQSTGLLDSKGIEIYESDIVQFGAFIFEVHWHKNLTGFMPFSNCMQANLCTVIGNKYEHSELMDKVNANKDCWCCNGKFEELLKTQ